MSSHVSEYMLNSKPKKEINISKIYVKNIYTVKTYISCEVIPRDQTMNYTAAAARKTQIRESMAS